MPRVEAVRCLPTQHRRGNGTAGGSARCMGHWDSGSRCRERRASQYTRCVPGQWKVFLHISIPAQTDKFDCHFALKDHHKSSGETEDLWLRNRHEALRIVRLLDSVVAVAVASKLVFKFHFPQLVKCAFANWAVINLVSKVTVGFLQRVFTLLLTGVG